MFENNELITLLLSIPVLIFLLRRRRNFLAMPRIRILIGSFVLFLLARICTNAEGIALRSELNLLEHASYFIASASLCVWTVLRFHDSDVAI